MRRNLLARYASAMEGKQRRLTCRVSSDHAHRHLARSPIKYIAHRSGCSVLKAKTILERRMASKKLDREVAILIRYIGNTDADLGFVFA